MEAQSAAELNPLLERLMDEDEDVRYNAVREIVEEVRPPVERIVILAEGARPRMREMACILLSYYFYSVETGITSLAYPEGITTLVHLLGDADAGVRAAAVDALAHHKDPSTLPPLIDLANDPSEEVRYSVACTLGCFYESTWESIGDLHKTAVGATLMRLMDDEDDDVRDWSTFGIHQGGHNTMEARACLWNALDDSNPDVRGEAAEGLARFGDPMLRPRLEVLLYADEEISPCYFIAAEILGDPTLLPAVEAGAERWRSEMEEGEEMNVFIPRALQVLRAKASAADGDAR